MIRGAGGPILYCVRLRITRGSCSGPVPNPGTGPQPDGETTMRHDKRAAAAILMAVTATAALQGIYVRNEVRTVPVARLATNLERDLAANPKSPEVHLRLARLYGMAFAMNSDE